jgi:hypothetical protein
VGDLAPLIGAFDVPLFKNGKGCFLAQCDAGVEGGGSACELLRFLEPP